VRRIYADLFDELGTDARDGGGEIGASGAVEDARCDCYTSKIRHFVRLDRKAIAVECACGGLQDQVERVLCVDSEAGDLCACHIEGTGNGASFVAIAVETEAAEFGGGEDDGVPFEDDGGLGRVAAAERGRDGGLATEVCEKFGLEGGEGAVGVVFCGEVAGDIHVDDAAGGDIWWEEDGGEFDLVLCVSWYRART